MGCGVYFPFPGAASRRAVRTLRAGCSRPIQIILVRADIRNHSRWCIIGLIDRFRPNVRHLAAEKDVAALLLLLGHRNRGVRDEAGAALHGLAVADPDPFLSLLTTGTPELRRSSAEVLATVPGLDMARLVAALGGNDETVPEVAAILARNGERAQPELLRALGSGQDQIRDGAVLALTMVGPATWPALVPRLRDPSRQVRQGAARVLGETGWKPYSAREAFAQYAALGDWESVAGMGPAAEPFLIDALADPHADVREAAARTLGRCGDSGAVRPLLRLLARDPEEEVREAAAQSLGLLAHPGAVPGLRAAVSDRAHAVRFAAATALGTLGWSPENDDETVAFLIATAQLAALGRLGTVAVPQLVGALGDGNYGIRHGAGETLLALGGVARPALERARTDPDPAVREAAASVLARMGPAPPGGEEETATGPPAVTGDEPFAAVAEPAATLAPSSLGDLVGLLYVGSPAVRLAAARALASMPPERAVPALAGALLDPDPALRGAAVASLGAIATSAAMPLLVDRLADPDDGVRTAAVQALAQAGAAALPSLVAALGRPERDIRAGAARILEREGYPAPSGWEELGLGLGLEDWRGLARFGADAVEPLAALLVHPDPDLRLGAVIALGEIGGDRATHLLRAAGLDPSAAVRHRAALLLQLQPTGVEED